MQITAFSTLSLAATLLSTAFATPVPSINAAASAALDKRIVFNPEILSPKAGDVWQAGKTQTVTWKTSDIPQELKTSTSQLKLGYEPADGKGGENLRWTLADKFPLTAGTVSFTVPADVKQRDDYIVVLLGDSGNASPHFKINTNA